MNEMRKSCRKPNSNRWILQARHLTLYDEEPLSRLEKIQFFFFKQQPKKPPTVLLDDISFDIFSGKVTAVVGTSTREVTAFIRNVGAKAPPECFKGKIYTVCGTKHYGLCENCVPSFSGPSSWQETNFFSSIIESNLQKSGHGLPRMSSTCTQENISFSLTKRYKEQLLYSSSPSEGEASETQESDFSCDNEISKELYIFQWNQNSVLCLENFESPLLPNLTVKETFSYHLSLLHPNFSRKCSERLVCALLRHLDLEAHCNTKTGSLENRILSTGERCRVILGLQFLNYHRKCIVLNNPTNQIDTFHAEMLFQLFRAYSQEENKCCVISLIQPTQMMLHYIDDVVFLHHSKVIYCGPLKDLRNYMISCWKFNSEMIGKNPLEFLLKTLSSPNGNVLSLPRFCPRMDLSDSFSFIDVTYENHRTGLNRLSGFFFDFFSKAVYVVICFYTTVLRLCSKRSCRTFQQSNNMSIGHTQDVKNLNLRRPAEVIHQMHFFKIVWILVLRFWLNAARNQYKMIPLVIILFQGIWFGLLFRSLKVGIFEPRTERSLSPLVSYNSFDSAWFPKTFDVFSLNKSSLVRELEDALVDGINTTEGNILYRLLTDASTRLKMYHVINCSYVHCSLDNAYGPLKFQTSPSLAEPYHAIYAILETSRLVHASWTQKIVTEFKRIIESPTGVNWEEITSFIQPFFGLAYACLEDEKVSELNLPNPLINEQRLLLWPQDDIPLLFSNRSFDSVSSWNQLDQLLTRYHLFKIPSPDQEYMEIQKQTQVLIKETTGYTNLMELSVHVLFPLQPKSFFQRLTRKLSRFMLLLDKYLLQLFNVGESRGIKSYGFFVTFIFDTAKYFYIDLINVSTKRFILSIYSSVTLSACLFSILSCMSYQSLLSLFAFHEEKQVIKSEVMTGLNSPLAFFVAQQISDLPFQILSATLFSVIFGSVSGFFLDPVSGKLDKSFYTQIFLCNLIFFVFWGFSQFISLLVHRLEIALVLAPYCIILWLCFSGIVLQQDRSKFFLWEWICFTSPHRYGYFSIILNYINGKEYFSDITKSFIIWLSKIDPLSTVWENIINLLLLGIVFRIFSLLCIQPFTRPFTRPIST